MSLLIVARTCLAWRGLHLRLLDIPTIKHRDINSVVEPNRTLRRNPTKECCAIDENHLKSSSIKLFVTFFYSLYRQNDTLQQINLNLKLEQRIQGQKIITQFSRKLLFTNA